MKSLSTKLFIYLILTGFTGFSVFCQTDEKDSVNIKTGWTFGAVPAVTYNSDLGLQYGGIINFYYHGDGSNYPAYLHSLYFEVSRYTKGSGINRFFYDSKHLIPGFRITTDFSYLTDQANSFYGFNGAEAVYNPSWIDKDSDYYRNRLFYAHDRKIFRFTTDLQKSFLEKFRWIAGIAIYDYKIATIDTKKLNKGKSDKDKLPENETLYDRYVKWGIIPESEKDGGFHSYLKGGVVYDTRDNEKNPFKGLFTEMVFSLSPRFPDQPGTTHMKGAIIHRQYFTLVKKRLALAYRVMYQRTIFGEVPFYLQPYLTTTFLLSANNEGLGGARTIRGVLQNRVVGDDDLLTNLELRSKVLYFRAFKQNFYLGVNLFADGGMVTRRINYDKALEEAKELELKSKAVIAVTNWDYYFSDKKGDTFHIGVGAGLRLALNENFIVAFDFGRALKAADGGNAIYINLNYMF